MVEMVWLRVEISVGVVPRRVIFLVMRVASGREALVKGGLRTPTLGVIMYFWFARGMERLVEMVSERSIIVASAGKT